MTQKAREVLNDCRVALNMLENEEDWQRWRVIWIASVALIRTVGHVLDKVDGERQEIKKVSGALYKEWRGEAKEHLIFREFIEKERNSILKEYSHSLYPCPEVPLIVEAMEGAEMFEIGNNLYRPLCNGPWCGEDARDVLSEAIVWWEWQLSEIDGLIKADK